MAKCIQCSKRCDRRWACPFCHAKPLCLRCRCDNCWCSCEQTAPDKCFKKLPPAPKNTGSPT